MVVPKGMGMRDWMQQLSPTDQRRAVDLIELLTKAGIHDAEDWARSEILEGIPHAARAFFLRSLWPTLIDRYLSDLSWIEEEIDEYRRNPQRPFADAGAALERMQAAGTIAEDIGSVARYVAYSSIFRLLYHLDFGSDQEFEGGPGWQLMEVDTATGQLTGRVVGGLYEDLLTMDPTGREGSPGYTCPVCGYPSLVNDPDDLLHEICPSCGIQFGLHTPGPGADPVKTAEIHARWRQKWIDSGMHFHAPEPPPPGWDPQRQLRNIGIEL
jgi:hypothetical protein